MKKSNIVIDVELSQEVREIVKEHTDALKVLAEAYKLSIQVIKAVSNLDQYSAPEAVTSILGNKQKAMIEHENFTWDNREALMKVLGSNART